MFSIKVIEDGYGGEWVKSDVRSVKFNPPIDETKRDATLYVWYKDQEPETIYSGLVYVMNENGKTVADYRLLSYPKIAVDGKENN